MLYKSDVAVVADMNFTRTHKSNVVVVAAVDIARTHISVVVVVVAVVAATRHASRTPRMFHPPFGTVSINRPQSCQQQQQQSVILVTYQADFN